MKIVYTDTSGRDRSRLIAVFFEIHRWIPGRFYEAISYRLASLVYRRIGSRITIGRTLSLRGRGTLKIRGQVSLGNSIFKIDPFHSISIGSGSIVDDGVSITVQTGDFAMGEGCFVGRQCHFDVKGAITLGDRVAIAAGTKMFSYMHTTDRSLPHSADTAQGISIGDNVWIGANVVILDNVNIGDRAVIGAGAVVAKPIPAQSLALGVPARVIKQL